MTVAKPVTLQLNARGSWRNVCDFDCADQDATDRIMEAGATLGTYSNNNVTLRIAKDDCGLKVPLMSWDRTNGWVKSNG